VKVETGSIKPLKKTGMAGIGEVLPLKFGDFLLDFILVLSNVSGIFMETENYRYPQCVHYPCQL